MSSGLKLWEAAGSARLSRQTGPNSLTAAGGDGVVFTLGVGADNAAPVIQQVRDDDADALPCALGGEDDDGPFRLIIAQELAAEFGQDEAGALEVSATAQIAAGGETGGAEGRGRAAETSQEVPYDESEQEEYDAKGPLKEPETLPENPPNHVYSLLSS